MSTKNSRKVLSVLLAYMMVLSSFSGMAVAAKEDPAATTSYTSEVQKYEKARATDEEVTEVHDSGELLEAIDSQKSHIKLAEDIDLTEVSEESEEAETYAAGDADLSIDYKLTLDLAGHTLTVNHLDIADGGDLTLKDSNETGTITSADEDYTIQVLAGGALTINGGTYTNTSTDKNDKGGTNQVETIINRGSLTVTDGTIEATTNEVYGVGIYIQPTKDDDRTVSCTIKGGKIVSNCYGVAIFGRGIDENGEYNNNDVTLDMSGGEIEIVGNNGGQGIATNASNGIYAGFTIDLSGNAKITANVDDGCAMYLPGPGVTNISDSVEIFGKLQGIRIAAGVLNIEGGTIQNNNNRVDNADLVSGGSGGTAGAVVVGKASGGYPDDIIINVTGGKIENMAGGDDNDAIVVSDKNMADINEEGKLNYDQFKIEVNVSNGADVTGNVYTVSNLTPNATTKDGGDVSVKLDDVEINGDIENASKSPVTATNVEVNSVKASDSTEADAGKVVILNSIITEKPDENSSNIIIVDSEVAGQEDTTTVADEKIVDNKGNTYDNLDDAISALEDGMSLILGKGDFSSDSTITIDEDNVTILGTGAENTTIQTAILVTGDNFAIKDLSIDSDVANTDALKFAQGTDLLTKGTVENVTVKSSKGHALNVHGVKNMTITNFTAEEVDKLSLSISNSENVTVDGFTGTNNGGWNADIGIMYESDEDKPWYGNAVNLTLKGKINFAHESPIYSEFTTESVVDDYEKLDTIIWEKADGEKTILYKVLGNNGEDTSQYHYVTSDKIEASIDDKLALENPTGYETLEEAIKAAKDEEEIDLHQDVENVTIGKKVTINGNGNAITGEIVVNEDGASITGANLEDATFEIEDGTTIDLSDNYWGGEAPPEIEGAVIRTYYDDLEMKYPVFIEGENGLLETIKDYLTQKNYTVSSEDYNTEDDVFGWLMGQLKKDLANFNGEATIVDSGFTPAEDGTEETPEGTNGSYTFKVELSYNGQKVTTEELTVTITAAEYVPDEPEDPDDDDKDDDDNDSHHSSSGGSSGGGSFIGHPDGWVPGGIIILDGSEQIQPTGSLLLDTKTYTMAPGVVYDILATLEGASENELRVYSSQPGVASVEAIGGGKYRVTGLADGQTYIMFEVWRDGVMLNHASVKVTIADGVTAYGESNREASIF